MTCDPICTICGEPRSTHIPTEKGPLTHPREARSEGMYVLKAVGTIGGMWPGDDDTEWTRYEFVPSDNRLNDSL